MSDDVKDLCNFAENQEKTVLKLKSFISNIKNDYIGIVSTIDSYKDKLSICEKRLDIAKKKMKKKSLSLSGNDNDNLCSICMTNNRDCVYVTCGHYCACIECCEKMDLRCPICRQDGPFMKVIHV